ncbi:ferredoxin FdxA [Ramlibacter sp.]|uniref:ferredoxin FdxA n=1 Tax=Ramlibacter sp. TaxID=1917967 RepID=UPI002FCB4E04
MTYVVTEACINCKHTDCVEVCPADAFHEGPNFLVINPDLCVDCDACVAECPVEAIYADTDVPAGQREFLALNAELSRDWPSITKKRPPLPDAAQWAGVREKFNHLQRP